VAFRHIDVPTQYRLCLVWEASSALRHQLRNKLAAVRNAAFYLERRVMRDAQALASSDPRVPTFFELIRKELDGADTIMTAQLPGLSPEAALDSIDLGAVVDAAIDAVSIPDRVEVRRSQWSAVHALASNELAVAVFCLIENAIDAVASRSGGMVTVTCRTDGERQLIEVVDNGGGMPESVAQRAVDPMFTTRPGRLGLGLTIARRLSTRSRGTLEVVNVEDSGAIGVRATIAVPAR
jgi:signal transduction histidine kinase